MMNAIKADFAKVIKSETGADVEFTMINEDKFSIFTLDGERFPAVVDFIQQIPGVALEDTHTYAEEGEESEYYGYFTTKAVR